ncbi:hypothetical protein PybrP1_000572 [[Pythium] brassicae (nom. inval.)]|nr:hypothetical protein PybrP1_000572 [[Pythium] brassicae (nom. inval.)]
MDAVMSCFGLTVLYIFPPPPPATAPFDLEHLHDALCALAETEYRELLGELHVHPTTGVVSVKQSPEVLVPGAARRAIAFEKVLAAADVATDDAMRSLSQRFMPARAPTELFAVKATLLSDGGLALGLNMTHTMFDGEALFTFVKVWGEFYRGVGPAERTVVTHDRQLLAARGTGARLPHPEFKQRAPMPPPASPVDASEATAATPAQRVFHVTPEQLQRIKAVATGTPQAGEYVSTIDGLTALLLLLITQARGHGQGVRFTTGVNGRQRFSPPLPPNYAGNVIFNALSTYDAHEVAAVSDAAVQLVARRVRASIVRRDDEFMRDAIEFVAAHENLSDVLVGTDFYFGPDLMLTSWVNFGMYDADFGSKPWYVGVPELVHVDGMVIVMEGIRGATGVDVVVMLEATALAKLADLWEKAPIWG